MSIRAFRFYVKVFFWVLGIELTAHSRLLALIRPSIDVIYIYVCITAKNTLHLI